LYSFQHYQRWKPSLWLWWEFECRFKRKPQVLWG